MNSDIEKILGKDRIYVISKEQEIKGKIKEKREQTNAAIKRKADEVRRICSSRPYGHEFAKRRLLYIKW